MEKNLAPIKCAIIESKQKKSTVDSAQGIDQEKPEMKNDLPPKNKEDEKIKLEKEIEKVHEQYRKMWKGVLQEIQKKKINEIKVRNLIHIHSIIF